MAKYGWKFEQEFLELSGGNVLKVRPLFGDENKSLLPINGSISYNNFGAAVFDRANTAGMRAFADCTPRLTRRMIIANGAQGQNPSGGFTCTGLFKLANGNWLVGNDGRTDEADTTFSPSLVELSPNADTIINELDMSGIIGNNSVQGVIEANDGSYWLASPNADAIYNVNSSTGALITSFAATDANGLAYNSTDNVLYWCSAVSSTVHIYDIDTSTEIGTLTIALSAPDQLCYKDGVLYCTAGLNGENGQIVAHDVNYDKFIGRLLNLPVAQAIEGIYVGDDSITVSNDGGFHVGAYPPRNFLLEYAVKDFIPSSGGFLGVHGKLTLNGSAPVDRETFVTHGKPYLTSTPAFGWALYFMDTNELRLLVRDPANPSSVYLAEWAITRGVEFTFDVYLDINSNTVKCEINGVDQGAPVTTVGTLSTLAPALRYTFANVGVSQETASGAEFPIAANIKNCFVSTTLAEFNELKAVNNEGDVIVRDISLTVANAPDGQHKILLTDENNNLVAVTDAEFTSGASSVKGISCGGGLLRGYVDAGSTVLSEGCGVKGETS